MAGSGPAPVEYKGQSISEAGNVAKAQIPAFSPNSHSGALDSGDVVAAPAHSLSESDELDMLDVEPEAVETSPSIDEKPIRQDYTKGNTNQNQGLSEAEELDMLDVEPGSPAPVEMAPVVDTSPSAEVLQTQVRIPAVTTSGPQQNVQVVLTRDRPGSVKVQTGDTLFSLSEKYQVALQPLIDLNGLKKPYALNKGQMLKLPPPLHYRVQKGDTLYSISRRYNVHFQSLAGINGIEAPFVISPDSILVLPTLARDSDGQWRPAVPTSSTAKDRGSNQTKASTAPVKQPAVIRPASSSSFIWPVKGKILSKFGGKAGGMRNDGINIAVDPMEEVVAAGDGIVIYSGSELKNFGRLILIRHDNGWVTAYAHNSATKVLEGARVKQGQVISLAGSTGSVDVAQLHFETRKGVKPLDPLKYLPKL